MILESMTISNFRQYYGTQSIFFSKDPERNVTVIRGENGSGKTALLNAFIWCLYGEVGLPFPNLLLNNKTRLETEDGSSTNVSVELRFEDKQQNYLVSRSVPIKKSGGKIYYDDPKLKMHCISPEGLSKSIDNPQEAIEQIIPRDLVSYFFFDGERIQKMTETEKSKDLSHAVKIIMGLEIFERGSNHLNKIKGRFLEESAKDGGTEIGQIVGEIKEIEKLKLTKEKNLEQAKNNKDALDREIENVKERLRTIEASADIQRQIDELENLKKQFKEEHQRVHKKLIFLISKKGGLAFCGELIGDVKQFLDHKREKGEVPTGIKRQFVDDILERGVCICGTPIKVGSHAYECVKHWRSKASTARLEDAVIGLNTSIGILANDRESLFQDLKESLESQKRIKEQIEETDEKINSLDAQLVRKEVEEVQELKRKEENCKVKRDNHIIMIATFEKEISDHEKHLVEKQKAYQTKQVENEKAMLAKRRFESCSNVENTIRRLLGLQTQHVLTMLQERVSKVYKKMLRKDFSITVDDKFELFVNKRDTSDPVPLSQGEQQITSLAFVGALIEIAQELYKRSLDSQGIRQIGFEGGYYPMVMDSPFGQLDLDHRRRVAESLPLLSKQIIVMVAGSQWRDATFEGMKNYIGREYELLYHAPLPGLSGDSDSTSINEVINCG
jgi:DNA sulfur modification protein DndD